MRVGVYNRWLPTLGGGERYTLDFARVLAEAGHQVELLVHQPLDLEQLRRRLALPPVALAVRRVPDSPGNARLAALSAEYDLLLNLSQGDLFEARAQRNVLVVHFPAPLESYASGGEPLPGPYLLAPSTLRWLAGVYSPERAGARHWAWTGGHAALELRRRLLVPAHTLELQVAPIRPAAIPPPLVQVRVAGQRIAERGDDWQRWCIRLPAPVRYAQTLAVELDVTPWNLRDAGLADDDRERGLPLASAALLGSSVETRLPLPPLAGLRTTSRSVAQAERALASYTTILANSAFTQGWISRRWGRDSTVLYPAVDAGPEPTPLADKQPIILSVGRFFAGAHNKAHLPMIAAFRALCDGGLRDWEYHLVGGCDLDQPEQRAYLDEVRAAAAGYPIRLHVNAPFAELAALYRAASLFWHAAGYGVDERAQPELVEHFGITTIEAMAAGCVPVVIRKGGQIETVEPERSGLLWTSLPELEAQTQRLIADLDLRQTLAAGAIERSRGWHFERFRERALALLDGA